MNAWVPGGVVWSLAPAPSRLGPMINQPIYPSSFIEEFGGRS